MDSNASYGTLTYPGGTIEFGTGKPIVCVNDQCGYLVEDEAVQQQILRYDFSPLLTCAMDGKKKGLVLFNVQIMTADLIDREVELLPKIVEAVWKETGCGVSIDTRNPEALDAALRAYPYKALCNCINGEQQNLETLLPIAAAHGSAIGTALVDEQGIPDTLEKRLRIGRRILTNAEREGIPFQDVMLDGVCMPAGAVPDSMRLTLQTIKAFKEELGSATLLGISNAGFGMPNPTTIDAVYFIAAASWGLDVAMISPYTPNITWYSKTIDFLMGIDPYAAEYLSLYRSEFSGRPEAS